jgi:hypothetical protein
MRCLRAFAIVATLFAATQSQAQNLLTDPGFEDPTKFTADGAPFVGFWEAFQGGTATSALSTAEPRSGASHAAFNTLLANQFAGVFQDVPVTAGQIANFSVWHKTTDVLFAGTEMRIEWRNAGANTEISRTPNLATTPTLLYTPLSLIAPVPAGADTARVVYAIQSFGAGPDIGTVYLDDTSVTVVPEPSTLALVGLAGAAAVAIRRRRA